LRCTFKEIAGQVDNGLGVKLRNTLSEHTGALFCAAIQIELSNVFPR
jgi:hypothetical protein